MKRLFVIHGWGGSPKEPMIDWLGKKGIELGYSTKVLEMPHAEAPTIADWVNHLRSTVGHIDKDTNLIAHSIGCQTVLRFLQNEKGFVGKIIFIAPWGAELTGIDTPEDQEIACPWLETVIDFTRVREKNGIFSAIFSDNDPFVPLQSNKAWIEDNLNAKIIIEKGKGHFSEADGVTELPSAITDL